MELYFLASGIKHELDYFEEQLQFQPFLLPYIDKEGKEWKQPIYGNLAPMKLYRYIFPEEYLDEVVKMLGEDDHKYVQFNKEAFVLRKILKADKIKKPKANTKDRLFKKGHVGIVLIGTKPDKTNTDPAGNTHEAI